MGKRRAIADKLKRQRRLEAKRRAKDQGNKAIVENSDGDEKIRTFVEWCIQKGVRFSPKVAITCQNVVDGRGMVATQDINDDEVLFEIPRQVLFSEKTCRYKDILCSSIAEDDQDLLVKEASENNTAPTSECSNASDVPSSTTPQANESSAMLTLDTFDIKHTPTPLLRGWAPLLLSMMLELDQLEASAFAAYFALLPNLTTLKHPHLWPQEERVQLLSGSRLHDDVKTDLALMNAEYNDTAKPFMEAHPELFDTNKAAFSFDTYARCAAIVMAYSFTDDDDGRVCLVPVADILNHVTGKNNARLYYAENSLQMRSLGQIPAGNEIFNTYGELDNLQLIQRHGFSEPVPTRWEEAMISLSLIKSLTGMGDARESIIKELVFEIFGIQHRLLIGRLDEPELSFLNWLFMGIILLAICPDEQVEALKSHIHHVYLCVDGDIEAEKDEACSEEQPRTKQAEGYAKSTADFASKPADDDSPEELKGLNCELQQQTATSSHDGKDSSKEVFGSVAQTVTEVISMQAKEENLHQSYNDSDQKMSTKVPSQSFDHNLSTHRDPSRAVSDQIVDVKFNADVQVSSSTEIISDDAISQDSHPTKKPRTQSEKLQISSTRLILEQKLKTFSHGTLLLTDDALVMMRKIVDDCASKSENRIKEVDSYACDFTLKQLSLTVHKSELCVFETWKL